MTEKDRIIQDLKRRVAGLEEELQEIIHATQGCRWCANLDADCDPNENCKPEWRGLREQ